MNSKESRADVVVVGAGLAGLSAARALTAAHVDVVVLEARNRVGGRVYTQPASDGTPLDLGAQWMGPTQDHLAALAAEVGVSTFRTYDAGENIEYRNGQRITYSGAIPTTDPLVTMEIVEKLLDLNLMAMKVPLDAPWNAPEAASLDAQTVTSWMEANISSEGARSLLTLAVQAVFSAEPRDLSLLHFLFYIHSGGNLNSLVSVARGAQESRFSGGAQLIANRVAEALGPRVVLNAPVRAISYDDAGVRVESDIMTVTAQRAIVAIPPTLAGRLRYNPPLPALRDQLTQRMPMGTVIKVHCLYETPFWRVEGLSGQATSDSGITRITFDNTPESGTPGILLSFIEGDEGRAWSQKSLEERRIAVLECLVRYFGEKAGQPYEYVEHNWAEEEYTRGCYAGYMPTGVWSLYGQALRLPIGRLHWAGTETATVWNGYMDGAIQSGQRAAVEVLAALGKQ
ncbi:MAG TPA: flavin monoamine oxidase family protein [Ktedonobacteraceae bacterium]|jgi:monoamine oxidase|nr:flavin monoamine oxidase family protein [Ktedonobacteraceae bacterium]